uniref:Tryptophan synthase alpha chain n=1 Tax=Sphondylothamnion multifidum TaxID=193186 RepID=A0A4D6WZQ5_9FLOR|nr:Tryptophan synthase alpha subunit [Sphondylothamnion multifidum]
MKTIFQILHEKNQESSCALIPFLTAGYPNLDTTVKALYILDRQGADIIELGIPYADALADGYIIQESSRVALEQGVYIDQVFLILEDVYMKLSAPIIIFTYYNPVLVKGIHNFVKRLANLGVKGLVIPDLPIEETDYILDLCNANDIELILFVAPTSSQSRISYILSKSPSCIYLVSSTGVTGTRSSIDSSITDLSSYIKEKTDKLIMIGFGISDADQVSLISNWNVDGIVVGSAMIKVIARDNTLKLLGEFCESMKAAINCEK